MARIAYARVSEIVEERPELTTFNNLLRRSGVIAEIDREGPYTLIAPTNAAFDRLPPAALGLAVADKERLHRLIAHHVVDGEYPTAAVIEPDSWPTLLDEPLSVMPTDNGLVIGSARVVEADLVADDGLVHIVDTVLFAE